MREAIMAMAWHPYRRHTERPLSRKLFSAAMMVTRVVVFIIIITGMTTTTIITSSSSNTINKIVVQRFLGAVQQCRRR